MSKAVWDHIEAEKKAPQPTPPVGYTVVWHYAGDRRKPVPARVYRYEEEPGRVALIVDTPQGVTFKPGVYHVSSRLNNGSNQTIARNGTWDYVEGDKVPQWHFDKHKAYIEKRVAAQENSEAMQAATEANMKAKRETAGV